MADKIKVEVVLCPDEQLKGRKPDPSWPRYPGLTVHFEKGGAKAGEATTNDEGIGISSKLAPDTYDVKARPTGPAALVAWDVMPRQLAVPVGRADQQKQIKVVPPAGCRLLPVQLSGVEPDGKRTPLQNAKVIVEAVGEATWSESFDVSRYGWVYALVPYDDAGKPIKKVTFRFGKGTHDGRDFEPVHEEITFRIPDSTDLQVDKPTFDYLPSQPRREQFQGILVKPEIRELSGKEVPLIGATVTVQQQDAASQEAQYARILEDDQDGEVRFPNLESGVYTVTVTPPMTFKGWPIKAGPKRAGPYYLSAGEEFVADVGMFGFEQINLLIETPDDRSLDHEVPLVIYGPDGSAAVSAKAGKFSAAAPSKFPLRIKLAPGAAPATSGIPLEMENPGQEVEFPPKVTSVRLRYLHEVTGRAVDESRTPMPGAAVVLYDGQDEAARAVARKDGTFTAGLKKAGSYYIAIQTEGGRPVTQRLISVHSPTDVGDVMHRRWEPPGSDGSLPHRPGTDDSGLGRMTQEAVTDLASYPVLTEQITTTGPPAPAGGGTAGGAAYGQVVDQAMRDVLGWRPSGDMAGFRAALAGAFQLREVEGHTEWTWQQRGYAVQADMGALTGAQASIYARAKSALDQIQPLLAGLTSLNPALYPPQDLEAIRTVVSAELQELVSELALEGGPRIQRVDELFGLLLGDNVGSTNLNPDLVQGQMGLLRDRFGLTVDQIETVDEERIVTNFRIVVEQVLALQASWSTDRGLLSGVGARTSLGTILIWLSRGLEAIAESVEDLTFALDSVYVDAAQRQVIELRFADVTIDVPELPLHGNQKISHTFGHHEPPLLLSDLLDWVVRASRDEGPKIVQDAGKEGVFAFAPVLDKLRLLVYATHKIARGGGTLPAGMRTPRADRAIKVLARQLDEAANLARLVRRDEIPQLSAAWFVRGEGVLTVWMLGSNFRKKASAVLIAEGREDLANLLSPRSQTTVSTPSVASAIFTDPRTVANSAGSTWLVALINEDGTRSSPIEVLQVPRQPD